MTYSSERYQKYKDSINNAKKRYYEKNRATILAKQKLYDDTHKDSKKERYQAKKKLLNNIHSDTNSQ